MKRFPGLLMALPALVGLLLLCSGCQDKANFSAGERPAGDPAEQAAVAIAGEGGKVKLSSENTRIMFVGSKPDGKKHNCSFKKADGSLTLESLSPGQTPKAKILDLSVTIEADSVEADDPGLTKDLKSVDFFAVKEHPQITFQSTKTANVPDTGWSKVNITGDLTIRGVTKPISYVLTVTQEKFVYVSGEFEINRKDFGLNYKPGEINDRVSVRVEVGQPPKK